MLIPIPDSSELAIKQAKEDLSKRKGIGKDKISVANIESVDWPDTSLGCRSRK